MGDLSVSDVLEGRSALRVQQVVEEEVQDRHFERQEQSNVEELSRLEILTSCITLRVLM